MKKLPIMLSLLAFTCTAHAGILDKVFRGFKIYTDATQYMWLLGDRRAERRFGDMVAGLMRMLNKVDNHTERKAWVRSIFDRCVATLPRKRHDYTLTLLASDQVNAFAVPGGHVFVYRGMLDFVQSDAELAAIIGHEITHVQERHSLKQMRKSAAIMAVISRAMRNNNRDERLIAQILAFMMTQKFSRQDEREADRGGMEICYEAGYDPSAMVTVWERMQKRFGAGGSKVESMLSSHPMHAERVSNAKKWLVAKGLPCLQSGYLSYNVRSNDPQNLLRNGNFETDLDRDGVADGWTVAKAGAILDDREFFEGRRSVRCESDSALGQVLLESDPIHIRDDKVYDLQGSFKTRSGRMRMYLGLRLLDVKKALVKDVFPAADGVFPPNVWTRYGGRLEPGTEKGQMPKGVRYVQVLCYGARYSKGISWIDGIVLREYRKPRPRVVVAVPPNEPMPPRTEPYPGAPGPTSPAPLPLPTPRTLQISNGDFEFDLDRDGRPDGWTLSNGSSRDPRRSSKGYASLHVMGVEGEAVQEIVSPLVPVEAGKRYRVTGKYWCSQDCQMALGSRYFDGAGNLVAQDPSSFQRLRAQGRWQGFVKQYAPRILPDRPAAVHLKLWLRLDLRPGEKAWIDDLEIRPR